MHVNGFGEDIAARSDESSDPMFDPSVVDPTLMGARVKPTIMSLDA